MKTTATLLALAFALAPQAAQSQDTCTDSNSQTVTVREINTIPQANVDALNAAGADVTIAQAQELLTNALEGECVRFTAVLLTDPFKSGIRSLNAQGIPGGIHTYARDVSAATMGEAGMGIQIVDFSGTGLLQQFFVGDEIDVIGRVGVFENTGGVAMQLAVESATGTSTTYGADDPLRQPVVITTDDIHDTYDINGDVQSQIDWSAYSDYNGQFVRFENIELLQGVAGDRPNLLLSSSGQESEINTYDTSVCFRNDRGEDYFPAGQAPDCIDDDFVPPPTGTVNLQGFLIFQGDDGAFNYAVPDGANFAINPFEEEDFEIAVAPPIVSIDDLDIPSPSAGAVIQATVVPGTDGNTIASVVADYTTSSGASGQVALSNTSGDQYEGTIMGLSANEFVTFTVTATDNTNAASVTDPRTLRVIDGPVSSITDVQVTPDGGPGASSIQTGAAVPFDLDAVVQTSYMAGSRFQATIQDDPDLGGFTGVLMDFGSTDPGLSVGDRINISSARVTEFRDATQLTDVEFMVTGSGDPYPAKVVTTDLFNGALGDETAEQHEGILLRFEDVSITSTNPDEGVGDFGEFAFSSDGTADNELRADDASNAFASDFNNSLTVGQALSSIEGYLSFSFGNYKLIPTEESDVQFSVSTEGGIESATLRILGSYPNPAGATVRVRFELDVPGVATLALYDVTGRQVAALAEGAFGAATHDVAADLGALAAGVYVLRLEAAGEIATARLAVVR